MFEISKTNASVGLRSQSEFDAITLGLQREGLKPLVRSILVAGFQAAGVMPDSGQFPRLLPRYNGTVEGEPFVEVFIQRDHLFLVRAANSMLSAWEIRTHESESRVSDFWVEVKTIAQTAIDGRRLRGMDFTWSHEDHQQAKQGVRAEQLVSKEAEYTDSDVRRSEIMSSEAHRRVLLRLAQLRGRARSADASAEAGTDAIEQLLDGELIAKEYLVTCKQDSHTICTVRERASLMESGFAGMRCPVCGRTFAEEQVQDILAISQDGTNLLNSSRWFTILITELVKKSGISAERIRWGASSGDDEIDIIVDVYGRKIFFELKDRDFGMGDAYPFLYRLERYGAALGVVVSTGIVAEEVKKVFGERRLGVRRVPIDSIEGIDSVRNRLPELLEGFSRDAVLTLVRGFEDEFGLDLSPILEKWMQANGRNSGS